MEQVRSLPSNATLTHNNAGFIETRHTYAKQ